MSSFSKLDSARLENRAAASTSSRSTSEPGLDVSRPTRYGGCLAAADYSGHDERRRNRRITPKGTVLVRAGTYLLLVVLRISASGLSATTLVTAPERLLTSSVEIELRFDGS